MIPAHATSTAAALSALLLLSASALAAGPHVYVANERSNDVTVIDTATNTVVGTIPVGSARGASDSARTAGQDGGRSSVVLCLRAPERVGRHRATRCHCTGR